MGRINRLPGGRVLSAGARACTSASGDLSCCAYNQLKKLAFSPPALPLLFSTHMLTDRGAETPLPQQLALNDISVGETSGTTPASSTSAVVCMEWRGWKNSLSTLWTGYVQSNERHSFCEVKVNDSMTEYWWIWKTSVREECHPVAMLNMEFYISLHFRKVYARNVGCISLKSPWNQKEQFFFYTWKIAVFIINLSVHIIYL